MKDFNRSGVMIDMSRNAVMNVGAVKKMIDINARLGYDFLMLYTEDTYEIEGQPYFGHLRGRYTSEELKDIDSYAQKKDIELIPCIQTLAHLGAIMKWPEYKDINDCADILLAGDERVYALIDSMFKTLSENFKSRIANIGMDEAHFIGLGKYMQEHGIRNRLDILLEHLEKVSEIAKKYGFELLMWGDMFFRLANNGGYDGSVDSSVKSRIPDNVTLIYWDYYSKDKKHYDENIINHKAVDENVWFAGGLWTWTGFTPHNQASIENSIAAIESCREHGVKNIIMTMWGDDGGECSRFSALPSMYAVSEFLKGNTDMKSIKSGFYKEFGIEWDAFILLDLPDTPNNENGRINDPEKYMLYSDCFMGIADSTVRNGDGKKYADCAKKLEKCVDNKEFGFLFSTAKALCDVLEIKYELGVRTRKAYKENEKSQLKKSVGDYDEVISRIELFYDEFERMWSIENKPHGFDVQDIRIGGTLMRIKHCKKRLESYINGEIDSIPELEEPVLPYKGNEPTDINNFCNIVTANVMFFQ